MAPHRALAARSPAQLHPLLQDEEMRMMMIECQCRHRLVVCLSRSLSLSPVTTTGVPYRYMYLLTTQSHAWCRHVCSTLSHYVPSTSTSDRAHRLSTRQRPQRRTCDKHRNRGLEQQQQQQHTNDKRTGIRILPINITCLPITYLTLQYIPYLGIGAGCSALEHRYRLHRPIYSVPHHRHRQGADIAC